MGLVEQIAKEHAAHDPHGFKTGFANSQTHSFPPTAYTHQEYPKLLYKGDATLSVHSANDLKNALGDGWSESPVALPADAPEAETPAA